MIKWIASFVDTINNYKYSFKSFFRDFFFGLLGPLLLSGFINGYRKGTGELTEENKDLISYYYELKKFIVYFMFFSFIFTSIYWMMHFYFSLDFSLEIRMILLSSEMNDIIKTLIIPLFIELSTLAGYTTGIISNLVKEHKENKNAIEYKKIKKQILKNNKDIYNNCYSMKNIKEKTKREQIIELLEIKKDLIEQKKREKAFSLSLKRCNKNN